MSFNNLVNYLSLFKTQALSFVHQSTNKVSDLDNYLVTGIINSLGSPLAAWLAQHPLVAWFVAHPLMAILVAFVTMVLLVRLLLTIYRAIAMTIDSVWLAILRSPWILLKFLFGWEAKPKTITSNTTVTNYEITNDSQQLREIMARLDQIQQQQQEIIQDLALLKQQPLTLEPHQLRLADKKIRKNQ